MSHYHLAQLNIAKMKFDFDDPVMTDFVDNLDRINQLADEAPGFVWRLITDAGQIEQEEEKLFDDDTLVNMSVWQDIESLHNYVYRTAHAKIMSHRRQWFEHLSEAYTVLWWIQSGKTPTVAQARAKLDLLRQKGPTVDAFTFKKSFAPPDSQQGTRLIEFEDLCPAN